MIQLILSCDILANLTKPGVWKDETKINNKQKQNDSSKLVAFILGM